MSSSHCESNCAPPLCYLPCLLKSKDDAGCDPSSGSPSPAAVAEDKPPLVQKIEEAAAATGGEDNDEKGCKEVAVASKSCLKRADCVDSSNNVVKGNVKWKDLLGKDLTQVKEFEPREAERIWWAGTFVGKWAGLDLT
ncbi:hypothetical protein BAE44_0007669 [Dichanthelium oligosanthes]|uniref:Uncharacterized protein n=1 Tax=Dichanthelium oligosanthes TaxID=888268 RepID=A0A1E5W1Q2_9POAL|nr:hypothetical protein BAE44_0007669 [Dichanthelium oligosanthes]